MTSDELENALLQMKKQWSNSSDEEDYDSVIDPTSIDGNFL